MKKYLLPILLYSGFLLSILLLVVLTDKGQAELWINSRFNESLGLFFKYATHLGDGLVYAFLFVGFLMYRYYYAILTVFIIIIQTLIVQVMKRVIFAAPRPKAYFQDWEGVTLHFVEGVKIHTANSFPSGHTASAFAIATLLTLYFNNTKTTILLFLGASVVAVSRVYLMQHFLEDVLVGASIGILTTIITFYVTRRVFPKWYSNHELRNGFLNRISIK